MFNNILAHTCNVIAKAMSTMLSLIEKVCFEGVLKGHLINRLLLLLSFRMKVMKPPKGLFNKVPIDEMTSGVRSFIYLTNLFCAFCCVGHD